MRIGEQIREVVEPLLDTVAARGPRRLLGDLADRLRLRVRHNVPVFYDPAYRLPFASFEATVGVEPRRADLVTWYLVQRRILAAADLRAPRRAEYSDLALVHTTALLESLGKRDTLASIYAVDPSDVPVDETLNTIRLACGGTLDAARVALRTRGAAVNLLGGFHHAAPGRAAGMCPVNDMAIAVARLRGEGFRGKVAILDLDAHPPDGTSECFRGDPEVWIGSLSGSRWDGLVGVDETVLPEGCGDREYLRALEAMLARMPRGIALAFVIAGGDVLAGDRFGKLGLSLDGVRRRDLAIAEALEGVPSVWLPGGGYHRDAWKILAGTVLVLSRRSLQRIPEGYDPMRAQYGPIWQGIGREAAKADDLSFTTEDLEGTLGLQGGHRALLLGHFTAEGLEYALHGCGFLSHLQRLGYGHFKIEVDQATPGDRMRLFGEADGAKHLLLELVVEKKTVDERGVLYVHWLTLRNPKAGFSPKRPQLPGQDLPGLGMAREAGQMLARIAREAGLQGVVYRPAWFHMAYAARHDFRYVDPWRQGRFEAILRDLGHLSLRELTLAFAQGRVRLNGEPYPWEPEEMIYWFGQRRRAKRAEVGAERARCHFSVEPAADAPAAPPAEEESR